MEATSTRCQAVLEAFRGRAAAARRMIESARRTVTELGLRHAVLEVEQFAGIVELIVGDPAAAEPYLRKAYNGFRRMGLDADTAETAALLGRACLALGRQEEAHQLCSESEQLAGHALKASIAWRTLRAHLLTRGGDHDAARAVAEEAVTLAERTDALVDHGDACLTLATVLVAAGDIPGARTAVGRAIDLYERKGAAALAEIARDILGEQIKPPAPVQPEIACAPPGSQIRLEDEDSDFWRLDNTVTRVYQRFWSYFADRDWDGAAATVSENLSGADHRRVVNAGNRGSRESVIEDLRVAANLGFAISMVDVVAIRGERLALTRVRAAGRDPETVQNDAFNMVEIDADNRITSIVVFDLDDFGSAIAELDAHYLAGEASEYAHCWSTISDAYATVNRQELPPMTPHFASTDHRRAPAFGLGEMIEQVRAGGKLERYIRTYVESVYRLNGLGMVCSAAGTVLSPEGFDAGWRMIALVTIEGDVLNRCEVFDETDLDAAVTRFEQLSLPASRPQNAASKVYKRINAYFTARDWDAMPKVMAENMINDDRRHMVNSGTRRGRDVEIANGRAFVELGAEQITSTVAATRGERLALCRSSIVGQGLQSGPFRVEFFSLVETDAADRLTAHVAFDLDDFDAAVAELDSRYLAGEAAPHARAWSVAMASYAALNRHELPPTTPNCVYADHRRETAFGPADLTAYFGGGWDLNQDVNIYVEEVHRLTGVGAVVTYRAHETSREGLDAEWRGIAHLTVQDELVSRCEVFDEADVESALAAFDQCNRPQPRLENQASRMYERFKASYPRRDWGAIAAMLADDVRSEDRRHVINAGVRQGPDAVIAEVSGLYDAGIDVASEVVAIRGDRLVLNRIRTFVRGQGAEGFHSVALDIVELNDVGRVVARLVFDLDDLNAALTELDARYLAAEAAPYAQTWQTIAATYTAVSRRELPPSAPQITSIDHRRSASSDPGKLDKEIRTYVEAVHQLDHSGAVVTYAAYATSQQGFDVEWHEVAMATASDGAVNHYELFEAADLDAALARFDEFRKPAPQLRNAANRVHERILGCITACEWQAVTDMLAVDFTHDDRRRAVNSGLRRGRDAAIAEMQALVDIGARDHASDTIATRGERLVLCRTRSSGRRAEAFYVEALDVFEIDDEETVIARVVFDPEDIDDAIAELENRYLTGEAARHARTWSAITRAYEALNGGELPAVTENFVDVDHRRGARLVPGDLMEYLGASLDDSSGNRLRIVAVPRLTDRGAVVTHVADATSREGFDAEWRITNVFTVQGGKISRCELYDVADLDAALARFDEFDQ